jgi:hypothetical protein
MFNRSILTVAFAVSVLFVVPAISLASPHVQSANIAVGWTNPDTGKMSATTINAEQIKALQALCKAGMDQVKALELVTRNKQETNFIARQLAKNVGPTAKAAATL